MALDQTNLVLTLTTPLSDTVILQSFNGEEQMSGLFRFNLKMEVENNSLSFDDIVGQSVTVALKRGDDSKQYFNGIVRSFRSGKTDKLTQYSAELVPKLWLLTLNQDSRVYQNKSALDIINEVLAEYGVTDIRDDCGQTYSTREYCVQYQESAFDFISRLMEDEGIFYFFEHEAGKHTLVLSDGTATFADCPVKEARIKFSRSDAPIEDLVTDLSLEHAVGPGNYVMDEFDYNNPSSPLLSDAASTVTPDSAMEVFEYPGGYSTGEVGTQKATHRMEEHELARTLLKGGGHCSTFRPSLKFTLTEHDRADMNQDYILKDVNYSATQDAYSNSFTAFPDGTPFRPVKHTAIPCIAGAQTATVVGPSGEEIYTDSLGRIKVQFHWDRKGTNNEESSCWIRVVQSMAGKSWGACFLPRIGQEVVVSFLEGNPARPLVTGAVYNGENAVPLTLPDNATQSTIKTDSSIGEGSNEIRFEDLADSEEFYFHAQKDMKVEIENDYLRTVLHDETHTITNDRSVTVTEGNETLDVTAGNRTRTVGGDESVTVSGKRDHAVTGNETLTIEGNYVLNVTGDITIKAGGTVTLDAGKDMSCTAKTSIKQTAGTTLTNTAKTSIKQTAGTTFANTAKTGLTNNGGSALTNKAISVTNDASAAMTCKGGASNTCESSGIMNVKGSLLKLN